MKNLYKIDQITRMLIDSRISKDKSQRWMAKHLRKSPTTISNWEEGISIPNILEIFNWFDVLGINPIYYFIYYLDSNNFQKENIINDETNKKNLTYFINNIATPSIRQKLMFNLLGNTGSYFESQLDMITAHNLCSLDVRVNNAWTIYHHYIMAKNRNELLYSDIFPNEERLYNAIMQGEDAAFHGKDGYVQFIKK